MAELDISHAYPDLALEYRRRKEADPSARARDIADALGVTEGMLLEARAGDGVQRLGCRGEGFVPLLRELMAVGPLMTLTRNEAAVHETTGEMDAVSQHQAMGQVTGAIDLRLFLRHWHAGYAVAEETRSGLRHSIQVFDVVGVAVVKIYAVEATDLAVWHRVAEAFHDRSARITAFSAPGQRRQDRPDSEIDVQALREGWLALEHSHEFHGLLADTGAGREQALRLAGEDLAVNVDAGITERMLNGAAAGSLPIMCFVGNRGCLQIFSGPVERITPMGPWLNVLDPGFNLHLRTDRVSNAWVVTKPTRMRGPITSLELFDADGTLVCQFFGARPPGEPEREAWRQLLGEVVSA